MIQYQNYHRHSWYTNVKIADSTVSPRHYAERAVELKHGILSSMEHGFQGNYYETYKTAKEFGLKPLIGCECYWVKDRFEQDRTNCHLYIGAMNESGRKAMNDVLSEANISGFYFQPRLDIPLILSLPKDDVIVTSACVAGWKYDDAEEIMKTFADHFGKNFYLEVQYHNTESQRQLNERILRIHNESKIPLIMGCDSHYIYGKQSADRDDLLASKGLHYEDEEGWYLDYPDGDEAYERFAKQCVLSHDDIVDAIANTNVFLDVEEYDSDIFNDELKIPSLYPDWTQEQKNAEYQRLVWNGWSEYRKNIPESEWPRYEAAIQDEIQTVLDTNMADYFIIDYHVIKKEKKTAGISHFPEEEARQASLRILCLDFPTSTGFPRRCICILNDL